MTPFADQLVDAAQNIYPVHGFLIPAHMVQRRARTDCTLTAQWLHTNDRSMLGSAFTELCNRTSSMHTGCAVAVHCALTVH